ncbi:16S rRNA (guanine(966)-N(2))-methyltransferase RsmD [Eikenella sp. NML96-A-049]|uniref:16S rRNA (guanine(966)-N(2))-methyltransferase RsmD n=1 Tax=unclassified Eikenella TaxID=2639367 RepID=UPI0007E0813A|nr:MULTISPECIES: 16S rRNA (guanine(966)-N(2))-methyltransferase RsmD [unclassified Eikenella]OAM35393.1 16S rRNA (guanine(966)-N(2))-methyltransferase RsmD [Eikenella sp. NML070372]OAM40765.1 16S rRNA (guanine(966)-N(2))-methyltransferase RsmD [Eikenella sp. NML96-A-049]VDH01317.1 methylase [Helicobacter pametensis]
MQKHNMHNKHKNQIRIIGGEQRGRKIRFADAEGLRPTADSVRERLFNWLRHELTGRTVLDLFAGSGALGFEAISRGVKRVVLVENNRRTAASLQQQIQELRLSEKMEVRTLDAFEYLSKTHEQFDVVFLDPPFTWREWAKLFMRLQRHLHSGAYIYVEAGDLPVWPDYLLELNVGRSGLSKYALLKKE